MTADANHSRHPLENPCNGGKSGDGGNRTHATFPAVRTEFAHPTAGWVIRRATANAPERPRETPPPATDLGVDKLGRKRSPATDPNFRKGVAPPNAGKTYPPDPYTEDEVMALRAACANTVSGRRLSALIAFLWRSGLRISEALAVVLEDLDEDTGTVLVRNGKGNKRGISGMDAWGFTEIRPWVDERVERFKRGPVFCVVSGATAGERWTPCGVRQALQAVKQRSGVTKRVAPHQLRHSHAVGMAREGVPVPFISKQLRHSSIGTTSTYLEGIAPVEVINAVVSRPAPGSQSVESSVEVPSIWVPGQ
jgi:integrase